MTNEERLKAIMEAAKPFQKLILGMHHATLIVRTGGKDLAFEADALLRAIGPDRGHRYPGIDSVTGEYVYGSDCSNE